MAKIPFKFKVGDPVDWNGINGVITDSWYDGQENRYSVLVKTRKERGEWSVRETSLKGKIK